MELPAKLQDFLMLLVTNIFFLGAVSSIVLGWLKGMAPSQGVVRALSIATPIGIAFLALAGQKLFGYITVVDENTVYDTLKVAIGVIAGQHVVYQAYKGYKGMRETSG